MYYQILSATILLFAPFIANALEFSSENIDSIIQRMDDISFQMV